MTRVFGVLLSLLLCVTASAKDPYPRNENIDVKNYRFQIELNDSTDVIAGLASISILFKKSLTEVELDLVNKNGSNGMVVQSVTTAGRAITFTHSNDRIKIKSDFKAGEVQTLDIRYSGIPIEGLIIGKNKFGDRTFFGDNWPDRGHHWLPCIDHPSDKAPVEFIIIAPEHYQVVATGKLIEESNLSRHRKLTHWKESADVAVKVMTIGVSRFAVQLSGEVNTTPISTWVFPQNREEGFSDFAVAPQVFDFFQNYIGKYSYEKLAHVQSKTRFGGLENAGNIFYFENSVDGKNEREALIAHETAHQWFGNSASENDWHHVWLSEGFATYFANLYLENKYGKERLREEMKNDRVQIIEFLTKNSAPIVDTTITNIEKVLSTNTYQKAGWFLHMLRHWMGDEKFHQGIRDYYQTYQNRNAMTIDFQRIMEKVANQDLSEFFKQWLYHGGHPVLAGTWSYDVKKKEVVIDLTQVQKGQVFRAELDLAFKSGSETVQKTVSLTEKKHVFRIAMEKKPSQIMLDPDTWLLFEGEIRAK